MTPDGIKEKFDFYRKWFKTLLVKEFMNLPAKYQDRFLVMTDNFTKDCRKVMEENKCIQEKIVQIIITKIDVDMRLTTYTVYGKIEGTKTDLKFDMPRPEKLNPKLRAGSKLCRVMYSIDGEVWYSSKEELITKITRG